MKDSVIEPLVVNLERMKGYDPSLTQGGSLAHYRLCYIRGELAGRVGHDPTVISLTGYRIYHLCFLPFVWYAAWGTIPEPIC